MVMRTDSPTKHMVNNKYLPNRGIANEVDGTKNKFMKKGKKLVSYF